MQKPKQAKFKRPPATKIDEPKTAIDESRFNPFRADNLDLFGHAFDLDVFESVGFDDRGHLNHGGESARERIVGEPVFAALLLDFVGEEVDEQDIERNGQKEEDGNDPALINDDAIGDRRGDDERDEGLEQGGEVILGPLDIAEEFRLQIPAIHLVGETEREVLEFADDAFAERGRSISQHVVGQAGIEGVGQNVLEKRDDDEKRIDEKREPFVGKSQVVLQHCLDEVNQVRRADRDDVDRAVFDDIKNEGKGNSPFVRPEGFFEDRGFLPGAEQTTIIRAFSLFLFV
jgi:hypothetical protein